VSKNKVSASREVTVQSFRIHQEGLARVFGELEAQVMDAVWSLEEPTVQAVCDHLGPGHHYKTVMTVLNRLVEKGALTRRRHSRAFIYHTDQSREVFLGRVSRAVMGGLVRDFGSLAVAQFVETLEEIDPGQLAELERLVQERRLSRPVAEGNAEVSDADAG
jgi:predicted transcriptional regulator